MEMTGVEVPVATEIGAVLVTFVTLATAADTQLKVPEPFVESTCPDVPLVLGSSHVSDDARVSGAFSATELVEPLSLSTSLFAVVLLPRIVTLPATVWAPELTMPVVLIVVEPPMLDAPLIVAADKVLLVRVSVASRVTTTPEVGKVAAEFTPVPPLAAARVPEVMMAALSGGISAAIKDVPDVTRPLTSYVTFVEVPPIATAASVAAVDPGPVAVTSPVKAVM